MRKPFFIGMLILVVLLVFLISNFIREQNELAEWEKKVDEDAQRKSESTYKMNF